MGLRKPQQVPSGRTSRSGLRKVAVVTGASSGIGAASARQLAVEHDYDVVLVGRSRSKCEAVREAISREASSDVRLSVVIGDWESIQSVHQAAVKVAAQCSAVDLLINNAGVMRTWPFIEHPRKVRCRDMNLELQIGVNHVSTQCFTKVLLPSLELAAERSGTAKILTVSSRAHQQGSAAEILNSLSASPTRSIRSWFPYLRYADSKLANLLMAKYIGRGEPNGSLQSIAIHPGLVRSNLFRDNVAVRLLSLLFRSPERAASEIVGVATLPTRPAAYYSKGMPVEPSAQACTKRIIQEVYDRTELVIGNTLASKSKSTRA